MGTQGLFLGGSRVSGAEIRDQNGEEMRKNDPTELMEEQSWPVRRSPIS